MSQKYTWKMECLRCDMEDNLIEITIPWPFKKQPNKHEQPSYCPFCGADSCEFKVINELKTIIEAADE